MEIQLDSLKNKKVHFVGIKGAGMAGLAKLFLCQGAVVSGSDISEKFYTDEILKKLGIKVKNFNPENIIKNLGLVIHSTAYKNTHPEFKRAKKLKIPLMDYAEALGFLFNQKTGIAVCGTHGKTTSVGMLGKIFKDAGLNPTVLVGGEVLNWKESAVCGKGDFFICEADEYQEKFLALKPKAVLITNIEYDHPDYFKNFKEYQNAFKKFLKNLDKDGFYLKNILSLSKKHKEIFKKIKLQIPGEHNRLNALSAFLMARHFGIPKNKILKSLADFKGMRRRLELKNDSKSQFLIIDDYAHHPTEIKASLKALKETFPERKIIAAFQPHTFSRTKALFQDFSNAFGRADVVAILDIYGSAREKKGKISSKELVEKLKKNKVDVYYTPTISDCRRFLKNIIKINKKDYQKYILLTMGAGDVWKAAEGLL